MQLNEVVVGNFYRLNPDFRKLGGSCGDVPDQNVLETTQVFIQVTSATNSYIHYRVYVGGTEKENARGTCYRCVKPEHLLPLEEPKTKAKVSFDSVILPKDIIEQVKTVISQEDYTDLIFNQWGFGEVFEKGTAVTMLFYGIPGTGKTLMAQAIADHLDQELRIIGTADLETSEPGGTERNIRKLFEEARKLIGIEKKKTVLLFDECDSLLTNRNEVGSILGAQVNALLTEIEKHDGVVILTTNRLGTLDPALERRISAKIEFPFPDAEAREGIWRRMFPPKAPIAKDIDFKTLAADYPLTGGMIKNIVLNAARESAYKKESEITLKSVLRAIKNELESSVAFGEALTNNHVRGGRVVSSSASVGSQVTESIHRKIDKVRVVGGTKKAR